MAAPAWMHPDEHSLADSARARLQNTPKSRVVPGSTNAEGNKGKAPELTHEPDASTFVDLKDTREHHEDDDRGSDIFRWAILYENQRGLTIFSTPYYSSRTLLPHDPRPFTEPHLGPSTPSSHTRRVPPNFTPATYMFPDPTWRWVSKEWLVDMRSDGDVQHDGFEYNWFFRRTHWRPRVGWFSAGGFVRRRRWIRLMMRPSDARRRAEAAFEDRARTDVSRPVTGHEETQYRVWRGDADDWSRVHAALKAHTRDGPRLELWAEWLSDLGVPLAPMHPREWTEESADLEVDPEAEKPEAAPKEHEHPHREWILAVLRSHAIDIRNLFIYPDSRVRLRDMFFLAGLAQDLSISNPTLSKNQLLGPSDFWNSTYDLATIASDLPHKAPD